MAKIKVGSLIYKVIFVKDLESDEGIPLHGTCAVQKKKIEIDSDHRPETRFITIWHETLHLAADLYGIGLSENQISGLATVITELLKENKGLHKEGII